MWDCDSCLVDSFFKLFFVLHLFCFPLPNYAWFRWSKFVPSFLEKNKKMWVYINLANAITKNYAPNYNSKFILGNFHIYCWGEIWFNHHYTENVLTVLALVNYCITVAYKLLILQNVLQNTNEYALRYLHE